MSSHAPVDRNVKPVLSRPSTVTEGEAVETSSLKIRHQCLLLNELSGDLNTDTILLIYGDI